MNLIISSQQLELDQMECGEVSNVQINAATPCDQPDHILNVLNKDCLRAIFFNLNLLDLTNIANVCIKFNEEAKTVYAIRHKKIDLSKWSRKNGINILQTFGSLTQSIKVTSGNNVYIDGKYETEIISTINRYCTPSLSELTLYDFWFSLEVSSMTNNMNLSSLHKLTKLSLYDCIISQRTYDLISLCVELQVLYVENCIHDYIYHIPKLDHLNEVRWIDTPDVYGKINGQYHGYIPHILGISSAITKLSLIGYKFGVTEPAEMAEIIAQNLPNLRELDLTIRKMMKYNVFLKTIEHLGRLSSLKVFKLDLNGQMATPLNVDLLSNASTIEYLKLSNGEINTKTVDSISQMKYLKILEFDDIKGLSDEHMIIFTNGLGSQLETLWLKSWTAKNLTIIGLERMLPFLKKLSMHTLESTKIIYHVDVNKLMRYTFQKRPENMTLFFEFIRNKNGRV